MEKLVKIEGVCRECYPCLHVCQVQLADGTVETRCLNGRTIANQFWDDIPERQKAHFKGYLTVNKADPR